MILDLWRKITVW